MLPLQVLEVQKNLRRFVARNMATQLATPTSQTPDEVGNVSLWVGQATTELNRDFPSASDTFTKSRAAFDVRIFTTHLLHSQDLSTDAVGVVVVLVLVLTVSLKHFADCSK